MRRTFDCTFSSKATATWTGRRRFRDVRIVAIDVATEDEARNCGFGDGRTECMHQAQDGTWSDRSSNVVVPPRWEARWTGPTHRDISTLDLVLQQIMRTIYRFSSRQRSSSVVHAAAIATLPSIARAKDRRCRALCFHGLHLSLSNTFLNPDYFGSERRFGSFRSGMEGKGRTGKSHPNVSQWVEGRDRATSHHIRRGCLRNSICERKEKRSRMIACTQISRTKGWTIPTVQRQSSEGGR